MGKIFTYRASDDEEIFIEENHIRWTELCRFAIDSKRKELNNDVKEVKRQQFRSMSNDLMLFFFGVICFAITYITLPLIVFLILNIAALICMSAGLILLIREALYTYGA